MGLVFFGLKYELLAYHILVSKYPTAALTLDDLSQLISKHGIPIMIIADSDGVLGAGKKWKRFLGRFFIPLQLSEPDKNNQHPVESAIQKFEG